MSQNTHPAASAAAADAGIVPDSVAPEHSRL